MNLLASCTAAALAALVAVGCSKKAGDATGSSASTPPGQSSQTGQRTFEITANDSMKFSLTEIAVAPGETFQVTLRNIGNMPKESMGHNFVLLKAGSDPAAYAKAALNAKDTDYKPRPLDSQVIAATKLLGPRQTDTITITAPQEPGDYPFVCSFPAHVDAGMVGKIVVK